MCGVTQPGDLALPLDELIGAHQGQLDTRGHGWWMAQFPDVESAAAFAEQVRRADERHAVAIHLEQPRTLAWAKVARLASAAPEGAVWMTDEAAGNRPGPREEVRPGRCIETVTPLHPGNRRHRPPSTISVRNADREGIESLFDLGLRVVRIESGFGHGKSPFLAHLARRWRGVHLDAAGLRNPWSLLYALGARFHSPLDERNSMDHAIRCLTAGIRAAGDPPILIDHVHEEVHDLVRTLVARTENRWALVGAARLGVRGEVAWHLGRVDDHGIPDPWAGLVDGHPLLGRLLSVLAEEQPPLKIINVAMLAPNPRPMLATAIAQLIPAGPRRLMLGFAGMPRSVPRDGLAHVVDLGEDFENNLAWLSHAGLLMRPTERSAQNRVIANGWLDHLQPTRSELETTVRTWGEWLAQRIGDWLQETPSRFADVTEAIEADSDVIDAAVRGLLELKRPRAADLGALAVLLKARATLAMEAGPAAPLLRSLDRALVAVGRSFEVGPDVALTLLETRAAVLSHLGQYEPALADLDRALGLAERQGEEADQRRVRWLTGLTQLRRGRFDEAEATLSPLCNGDAPMPQACSSLGAVYTAQTRLDEASEVLSCAENGREALTGTEQAELDARWALLHRRRGEPQKAVERHRAALDVWRRLGLPLKELITRYRLGTALQSLGVLDEAEQQFEVATQLADRAGDDSRAALILVQRGLLALERGDREAATNSFLAAQSRARAADDRGAQGTAEGFLAMVRHIDGDRETARAGYRTALRDIGNGPERRYGALFNSCLAVAEAELGNIDEARILMDMALLKLPEADENMGSALEALGAMVEAAASSQARERGETDAADELAKPAQQMLAELETEARTVYERFARYYLRDMLRGAT